MNSNVGLSIKSPATVLQQHDENVLQLKIKYKSGEDRETYVRALMRSTISSIITSMQQETTCAQRILATEPFKQHLPNDETPMEVDDRSLKPFWRIILDNGDARRSLAFQQEMYQIQTKEGVRYAKANCINTKIHTVIANANRVLSEFCPELAHGISLIPTDIIKRLSWHMGGTVTRLMGDTLYSQMGYSFLRACHTRNASHRPNITELLTHPFITMDRMGGFSQSQKSIMYHWDITTCRFTEKTDTSISPENKPNGLSEKELVQCWAHFHREGIDPEIVRQNYKPNPKLRVLRSDYTEDILRKTFGWIPPIPRGSCAPPQAGSAWSLNGITTPNVTPLREILFMCSVEPFITPGAERFGMCPLGCGFATQCVTEPLLAKAHALYGFYRGIKCPSKISL
nr:hypothetical protein [Salmonid herpesvirus 1]